MTELLIVEDHESMRDAISDALIKTGRYKISAELSGAGFAEMFCERFHPGLVLMDVCTEDEQSGISAAERLKLQFPEIKVVVMTGFDELSYLPRAKEAGADGFLYKSRSLSFFIEVCDRVIAGERCFPEVKNLNLPKGSAPLTVREMEVLRLLCKAMSNGEIAKELCISESTVKFHKANMLEKNRL